MCRVGAVGLRQLVEEAHRALAAREDGEQLLLARKVEPRHHALIAVADEKTVRAVGQRLHQFVLVTAKPEAIDVIFRTRLGVDHEDLGRCLLDDCAGDPALKRVLRTLCGEADNAVAFADRFLPVLDTPHENIVIQGLPTLIDYDDRGRPVEPFLDALEEVQHRRGTRDRIVEDRGHVEPDRLRSKIGAVFLVVE